MVWGKAGSVETTGASLTVTSVLDSKFYTFLYNSIPSGDMTEYMRLGSGSADIDDNYANRKSTNGGTEGEYNTRSNMVVSAKSGATQPEFGVGYIFNTATEEKLLIYHAVNANASGASAAPERIEVVGKWANTSDVMDVIQMYDVTGSGDYDTGSNLSVLGSDMTPAAAVTFASDVPDYTRAEITDTRKIYTRANSSWYEIGTAIPFSATRGVFGGGDDFSSGSNTMDYITIATAGNATDFGDITVTREQVTGMSSETRGVFAGGYASSNSDVMDYITIATTGNATDFGNLTVAAQRMAGLASDVRGVVGGAYTSGYSDMIDYITISTTGNATDFGNLTVAKYAMGAESNNTRGIFGGGRSSASTYLNNIDYITIATTGNATDFGDLTEDRNYLSAVASTTRLVWVGGNTTSGRSTTMDYVTIDTTGNATDFGDLAVATKSLTGVSSYTRGVIGGGNTSSVVNIINYITIATTGNTTDFGDLTVSRQLLGGVDGT